MNDSIVIQVPVTIALSGTALDKALTFTNKAHTGNEIPGTPAPDALVEAHYNLHRHLLTTVNVCVRKDGSFSVV